MSISIIIRLILACVLMIVASLSSLAKFSSWFAAAIGVWGMHYSVLLLCVAINQQINKEPYQSITRYPIFWITTIISIATAILQYFDQNNLIPFVDNKPFVPTFNYYATAIIGYSTMVWLIGYIVLLYVRSIRTYTSTAYRLRQSVIMAGFVVAFLSVLMSDISILIYLLGNHTYRGLLSNLYHLSKPIYYSIFIVGFMTPTTIIDHISDQIDKHRLSRKRIAEQSEDMMLLHRRMTCIAPMVRLPTDDSEIYKSRLMVEISQARDYIWSQEPDSKKYIAPKDDLHKILTLEEKGVILLEMGQYIPPPLKEKPIKHNYAVAWMLKKRDKSGHVSKEVNIEKAATSK